ncbi:MAG TPA: TRAP transporter substrate-binding protein [Deltaproteobacteria bacterium]|jgi:tripartite ATP-independent transporter DctP family solute receptor|nr:TRAP transporter substrate-binding protein [Deltaproteobacteria bacterium]HQI02354.1 TRAP transporter substrate-binding protein [Deltaproteobacteria bacterium]
MKKNRWLTMAALAAMCTILFSGMVFAAPIKARVSLCNSPTHPQSIGMQVFKKYVETRTKGNIQVGLYYNSQLGGERESVEQVKNGSLEMATASAGPLTTFNRNFMVLDIPFAFDSYEIAWSVLDGPMGQALLNSSEGIGLKGLAYLENGFRHVTNNVRPIGGPADLKGIKIRTMEAPMHMENFKALGANPTPVPWTELYLTMQQKIVDGQENPLANIWEVKMFEVQKYTSLTGHIYDPMPLVANLKWFNKLPKEYQAIVKEGAIMAQNYSRFVNKAREDAIIAKLTAKGMKVNAVSPAGKQQLRAKSQGVVVAKIKASVDKKFVDSWLAAITAVNKDVNAGF